MSQYFDFQVAFNLKEDVSDDVVAVFEWLTHSDAPKPEHLPDDDWFRTENPRLNVFSDWEHDCGDNICSFRRVYRYTKKGIDHYQYTFHFRCRWHDDDFYHRFWLLLPWLAKHAHANGFVGYFVGDCGRHPTLIYLRNGQAYLGEVTTTPRSIPDGNSWDEAASTL